MYVSKEPWFYGVMVSTLDFEFSDPSSNLGRTYLNYCCVSLKTTFLKAGQDFYGGNNP